MKNMNQEQLAVYMDLVQRMEAWPKKRAALNAERDELIREGAGMSVSNAETASRMEVSRNTVIAVLGTDGESTEEKEAGR